MPPMVHRLVTMPFRDPFAFTGITIYVLFALVALFADQLAPLDPMEILFTKAGKLAANVGPGAEFPLGTTNLGRDIYAQLVLGTRSALAVGLSAAVIVATVGTVVGLVSGYFGGTTDAVLMRIADMALSLPFLPFVIVLTGFLGANTENIVFAVALLLWPNSARVIRSQVLSLREREFIVAVRGLGAQPARIMLRHLLPNCLAPIIVQASLSVAAAILLEAGLSFLGVGVKPPTPTWGGMLRHAFETVAQAPWLTVSPGVVIFLIVLAFNFFGDALRDVLDPRLRGTR